MWHLAGIEILRYIRYVLLEINGLQAWTDEVNISISSRNFVQICRIKGRRYEIKREKLLCKYYVKRATQFEMYKQHVYTHVQHFQ